MSEKRDDTQNWRKPENSQPRKSRGGVWAKPDHALTQEQIEALLAARPESLPEPDIGATPSAAGAWYRPPSETDESPGLFDQIAAAQEPATPAVEDTFDPTASGAMAGLAQQDLGEFDPSRSGALQGIQANLGDFDESRSGALAGIGADSSEFDESQSSALAGIGASQDLGEYDEEKVGQLAGIGAATADEFDPNASAEGTQSLEETSAEALGADETGASAQPVEDPYANVEARVATLRQQFQNGEIDRNQLQNELRQQMIMDDNGRWWMVGMETDTWYRFDDASQNWIPDEPPRPQQPVGADAVPTATGLQEVQGVEGFAASEDSFVNADETPLPQRVPVDDLGATLVNQSAINLDEHRSYEAPTQPGMQVAGDEFAVAGDATMPASSGYVEGVDGTDFGMDGFEGQDDIPPELAEETIEPQKMDGIHPDYSEAFAGYWDRATVRKWAVRAVLFSIVGVLFLGLIGVLGMLGFYFYIVNDYQDAIAAMDERAAVFESGVIYDGQGQEIAQLNDPTGGARRSVSLEEISPFLIHATVSTEDETFYENPGFSIYGIARAIVRNLQTGGEGGGASTITQQLARAIVLDPEFASQRTATRKIEEIIVAAEIARQYSKSEILEFYLNEIYYANLAYGAEAASQVYFDSTAQDLNIGQSAFLAGLPQAPAVYDPVVNREVALLRMQDVLRLMTEANGTGCIQMQHEPYASAPFCVTEQDINDTYLLDITQVQVTTFDPPSFDVRYPHFVNYVYQELEDQFDAQSIYSSGFRIYTTLVPSVQDTAQAAVLAELPITPGANNGMVVAIRPSDGAVLALVGSADFNNEEIDGQVNVAFTPQQPGSSIKPLVYLSAFEGINSDRFWHPGTIIWDVPSCWGNYCPVNFSGTTAGPVSARFALGQSLNIPAVKSLDFVELDQFETTLDRFNVRTPLETVPEAGLPAALGGIEVIPFDMVRAYATLANGGVQHEPYAIQRIETSEGTVIYEAPTNQDGLQVVRPEHAYLITSILSDPNVRISSTLTLPGRTSAAKTGTTNDNRDVWTIGYTPEVAVGVWVGRTDNQPMGSSVFGSNTAAPIWNQTMQAALAGVTASEFVRPQNVVDVQVCSYTGALYTPETCPDGTAVNEIAFIEQQPAAESFLETVQIDGFSGLLANENCTDSVVTQSFVNISDATAISWLNTTAAGQAWAEARGIETPIADNPTIPTEACPAGMVRPVVQIASPVANQSLSGVVAVTGTVSVPNFSQYFFRLANASVDPNDFSDPLGQIYTAQQQGQAATLGAVDLTSFPNGNFILRLEATGTNGGSATFDVPILINNQTIQPTVPPPPTQVAPPPTQAAEPPTEPATGTEGDTSDESEALPPPSTEDEGTGDTGSEFEAAPPPSNQ